MTSSFPSVQPSWQVFVGCFDPLVIETALMQGGPVLLVPNNMELAEAAREASHVLGHKNLFFTDQLLGPEDGEMCWHCYSDFRFDGLASPEDVKRLVPNLRLLELRLLPVHRLDTMIHEWVIQNPQLASSILLGSGVIRLHCKYPSFVLAGAEHLVDVIDAFIWSPLGALAEDPEQSDYCFSQWTQPCPFQRVAEQSLHDSSPGISQVVWRQDPWLRSLRKQARLESELAQIRLESKEVTEERDRLQAQYNELMQEKQRMLDRCASLRQWPESPMLQKGDLKLCSDSSDPRFGSLLMLVSQPGEPEVWESANVPSAPGGDDPGV